MKKKSVPQLCGELDFSFCLLTEFVNRAAEFDEVLLRYVQKPWDKIEENEHSTDFFPLSQGGNGKWFVETLV